MLGLIPWLIGAAAGFAVVLYLAFWTLWGLLMFIVLLLPDPVFLRFRRWCEWRGWVPRPAVHARGRP